ncbi:Kelch repeat-containing protein [Sporocytophaga myxococcoides]|uniref:Kelch repeat-containing protein n=1 Tax=Sporocytophaga myxococcoides TaxID=153721 RepID=UPI000686993C|nr:kelch repeat-containing protein [Sporocytophaga myxococcoides]
MKINLQLLFSISLYILLFFNKSFCQDTGHWEIESGDPDLIHRHECGYVECDGKFYLIGGRRLGLDKYVNIYDPSTKDWIKGTTLPPSPDAPTKALEIHHFQAVAYKHKIFIVNAFTGNYPSETPVDRIYIYDPATDTWSEGPIIPVERRRGSAGVVVYGDKFYIAGGIINGHNSGFVSWFDEYNPQTNEWKIMPDAPNARDHFQAVTHSGKIYLTGGRTSSLATGQTNNLTVAAIDVFDFASQTWESWPNNIPTPRAGCSSVILGNELLVIGGEGPGTSNNLAFNKTEALNLTTKTWKTLAPLDSGRHATQAIVYNNKIYIAAGSKTSGGNGATELANQEIYHDPSVEEQIVLTVPDSINFGKVDNLVPSKTLRVNLSNTTSRNIQINGISIRENCPDFCFSTNLTFPHIITPQSNLPLDLCFSPIEAGFKSSFIDIDHSGINNPASIGVYGEELGDVASIKNKLTGITIYPNPVKDYLHLIDEHNRETLYWEILNSTGNKVITGYNSQIINFNEFSKGFYIVNIISEKTSEKFSIKIIRD